MRESGHKEAEDGAPEALPGAAARPLVLGGRHGVEATSVDSARIATVLYERKGGVLQVRFRDGSAYCYMGVPRTRYESLMRSKSKERYLRAIRRKHAEVAGERPGISEVRIQNYRSIRDMTVRLGDLTVLIGANGTGKTTVIDALELFLSGRKGAADTDYFHGSDQIDITLAVNPGGHAVPKKFLRDGTVRLQKSFSRDGAEDGRALKAEALYNVDFGLDRHSMSLDELKERAGAIRKKYPGAPAIRTKSAYLAAIDEYELELSRDPRHADRYALGFVKYVPDGGGDGSDWLAGMVSLVFVPAMKDIATDGHDGSHSHLTRLLELTVRDERGDGALGQIRKKLNRAHEDYGRAVDGRLRRLDRDLGKYAGLYMDNARFRLELDRPDDAATHPGAHVCLGDNGHMSRVEDAGSGFQRVYLLALLDLIADTERKSAGRKNDAGAKARPSRLIVIDEPEIYQHPQRQRRILRNFLDIVGGDPHVRIVCCTHSPYLVELRRVDCLRLLRRQRYDRVRSVTLEDLARPMLGRKRSRSPKGREELSTWLDMSATHWITEGFFASVVALVEGPGDRNVLLAAASAINDSLVAGRGRGGRRVAGPGAESASLEAHEVTIAPVDGVGNMPKFMRLFAKFGIPVYPIWDLDHRHCGGDGKIQKRNRDLAGLACGARPQDPPQDTDITPLFACFEDSLTVSLAEDLRACEGLLGDIEEYAGLCGARKADIEETERKRRQKGRRRARDSTRSQKRFLNSKLNVYKMLRAVGERDPVELEKFAAVRVVRELDARGKEARARAGGRPTP